MPSSTRSNKETQLIFSPDPASLERSIRKKARSLSTDNNTSVSLDSAQLPSTQTPVPSTDTRSSLSTDGNPAAVWRWPGGGGRRRKRRRRFPAAARVTHEREEAKLLEALAASFRLRLRRGQWLRLCLNERNTMVALYTRDSQRLERYGGFTEWMKTKLKLHGGSGG